MFTANIPPTGDTPMFKKSLIAAALLTVIAAPAFAQSFDPDVGSGNIAHQASPAVTSFRAQDAFAQAPGPLHGRDLKGHATTGADTLFDRAKGNIE
jgi:hypothetical protein